VVVGLQDAGAAKALEEQVADYGSGDARYGESQHEGEESGGGAFEEG
jgi:hypothetical protein